MLFFGCKKWYYTQKKVDKKQNVELKTAIIIHEKMNEEDRKNKDIRETAEQLQPNDGARYKRISSLDLPMSGFARKQDSKASASDVSKTSEATHKQMIEKYRQVENAMAKAITNRLSESYTIMSDMRIGSVEYNVIAESNTNNTDYIWVPLKTLSRQSSSDFFAILR